MIPELVAISYLKTEFMLNNVKFRKFRLCSGVIQGFRCKYW